MLDGRAVGRAQDGPDGVLHVEVEVPDAGDAGGVHRQAGAQEPDGHVELMDGVEQDPAAQVGPGGVGLPVVGTRAPGREVVAEPEAGRQHPSDLAGPHQVDQLADRRVEAEVETDPHPVIDVPQGGAEPGRGGQGLFDQDVDARRGDGSGLVQVVDRGAGDDHTGVPAGVRLVPADPGDAVEGVVPGRLGDRVGEGDRSTGGGQVAGVSAPDGTGSEDQDVGGHGARNTGWTGRPRRWAVRSSPAAATTAQAEANATAAPVRSSAGCGGHR